MSKAEKQIKHDEGFRSLPYKDTEGILTIGYGYNLEQGISTEVADLLFEESMAKVYAELKKLHWTMDLDPVRLDVVKNMIFNLGLPRFLGFKRTITYIKNGQYIEASKEMLDSKWAKQVGPRATRLSKMMETGKYG